MYGPGRIYGFDIETDNRQDIGRHGLIPARSRVTQIAIDTAHGGVAFRLDDDTDDAEAALFRDMDGFLSDLEPGLIATWNGAMFDLPFIDDRCRAIERGTAWTFSPDPGIPFKYDPLPGHEGGYAAWWRWPATGVTHQHLDIQPAYRTVAGQRGIRHGLKPVAASFGIELFEIERTRLHTYSDADQDRYCLSDAHATRLLATRLLNGLGGES